MSDYTNTGYSPSGGGGCLMPLAVAVLLLFAALAMMGGDDQANGNTAFSGNEVLSRNQVNVLSDVYNTFYDCYGAYSCVTTTNTTSTTTTSTTNAPVNVEGERNGRPAPVHRCQRLRLRNCASVRGRLHGGAAVSNILWKSITILALWGGAYLLLIAANGGAW